MSLAENLNPRAVIGGNSPPPTAEILAEQHADLLRQVDSIADRANSLPPKVSDDIVLGRVGDVVRDARKLAKRIDGVRTAEVEPHLTVQREINGFFKGFSERLDRLSRALESRATDYQNAKAAEERRKLAEQARLAREEQDRQREIAEAEAQRNRQGAAMKHEDRAEEAGERAARLEQATRQSAADLTRTRSASGTVATSRTIWDFEIVDISKIPLDTLRPYLARGDLEKAIRALVRVNKDAVPLEGVRIFENSKAAFR